MYLSIINNSNKRNKAKKKYNMPRNPVCPYKICNSLKAF